jgi:hypothetical protein
LSVSKATFKINIKIPSSTKNITYGLYGTSISKSTSVIGNTILGVSVRPDSYLRIFGNHRLWAGFLFW